MGIMDAVTSLARGKLSPADKKRMDEMKARNDAEAKKVKPEDAVRKAASPFSYLLKKR